MKSNDDQTLIWISHKSNWLMIEFKFDNQFHYKLLILIVSRVAWWNCTPIEYFAKISYSTATALLVLSLGFGSA